MGHPEQGVQAALPLGANPTGPHIGGVPAWMLPLEAQALAVELHARQMAETSLSGYCRRVVLPPDKTPALQHMIICSAIDDLLADRYDELIILAPPGSAKSTYTSIVLAAYFMGRWPQRHILTASHTLDLAEKWGRRVRGIVDSEEHSLVFPGSALSRENAAAGRWGTTAGGEFYAAGVGGSILGFRAAATPDAGFADGDLPGESGPDHGIFHALAI